MSTPVVLGFGLLFGTVHVVMGWIIQILIGRKYECPGLIKRQFRKAAAFAVCFVSVAGILANQNEFAEFGLAYQLGALAGGLAGLIVLFRKIVGPEIFIEASNKDFA